MGHLELTVFHILIIDSTTTNVSKIVMTSSAERAFIYLCNLVIGAGRKLKYREWNGRSNRYVFNLTCSRQSLKWNFAVFDVLKYFELTKSVFFFAFYIMLVSYFAGLSGHTVQPTSRKNA
jgi:hypothetical protein